MTWAQWVTYFFKYQYDQVTQQHALIAFIRQVRPDAVSC